MRWATRDELHERFLAMSRARPMKLAWFGTLHGPDAGLRALPDEGFEVEPYDFPYLDGLGFDRYWGILLDQELILLSRLDNQHSTLCLHAAVSPCTPATGSAWPTRRPPWIRRRNSRAF